MTRFSTVAMTAAFMVGASGIAITAPVHAGMKDQKSGEPAPLKLSKEVRTPGAAAQAALTAGTLDVAEPQVAAVEAAAKSNDERYFAQVLRLNLEVSKLNKSANGDQTAFAKGQTALAAPLDALLANSLTPQAEQAKYNKIRGDIEFSAGRFSQAATFYGRARDLGSTSTDLPLQIVRTKISSGDVAGGVADLQKVIDAEKAAGRNPPEDWYRYAIGKLSGTNMKAQSAVWLRQLAEAYPTAKNWRDVLTNYAFGGLSSAPLNDVQQVDIYRLMRQTKSLADEKDYGLYASLLNRADLPNEAVTLLDEGRKTGKVPSNSEYNALSGRAAKGSVSKTALAALEKTGASAATGDQSAAAADVHLGMDDYAKAATLYRAALTKSVKDADAVNTHLGIALALSGDKAGARTAFAQVKGAPRNEIAGFWTAWLNQNTAVAAPAPAMPSGG